MKGKDISIKRLITDDGRRFFVIKHIEQVGKNSEQTHHLEQAPRSDLF